MRETLKDLQEKTEKIEDQLKGIARVEGANQEL